jgi:hypothetical protein
MSPCHSTIDLSSGAQTRCVPRLSEMSQSRGMSRISQLLFHLASLPVEALSECPSKEELPRDCGDFLEPL